MNELIYASAKTQARQSVIRKFHVWLAKTSNLTGLR